MTVEAVLTRDLEIRFIDARALCNEAKLGLGVVGYPSPEQEFLLVEEAKKIFRARSGETQSGMITLKSSLDAVKIPKGSMSSGTEEDSGFLSSDFVSSKKSSLSRKFKMWPVRRRRQEGAKSGGEIACLVAPPQA
jgi:hypothetical protein